MFAGRPVQVLQACVVQVIEQAAHLREEWTQALALQTVCRCALHLLHLIKKDHSRVRVKLGACPEQQAV
jgi:hypothetical protein